MRITNVKELLEVEIDDGYSTAHAHKHNWGGHIREATINGCQGTVITIEGVAPSGLYKWNEDTFQLIIKGVANDNIK